MSEAASCLRCGVPVEGYKLEYCCNGSDCGCRGLPLEPPLCAECDRIVFGGGKAVKQGDGEHE